MASHANEEVIKRKIMDARKRGVCDKEGRTLQSFLRAKNGEEEKLVFVPTEQYGENYQKIFGHS